MFPIGLGDGRCDGMEGGKEKVKGFSKKETRSQPTVVASFATFLQHGTSTLSFRYVLAM